MHVHTRILTQKSQPPSLTVTNTDRSKQEGSTMDTTEFVNKVGSTIFNEATYSATISKISDCLPDFNIKLEEVASAVAELLASPLV